MSNKDARLKKLEEKTNINDDEIKKITIQLVGMDKTVETILVTHKRGNVWTDLKEEKYHE